MAPPVENNKTPKKEQEAVVPADTPMAAVSNALGSVNLGSAVAKPYSFNFNLVEHNNPNDDDDDDEDDDDDDEDEDNDDVLDMDSYPKYLKQRILFLKHLNDKREEMMKEYVVERAALEAKYAALTKPLYETRARVVKGEVTDEEIVSKLPVHDAVSGEDAAAAASGPEVDTNVEHVTGIPQFWVNAMGHMHIIAECMTEQDVECLEHLTDILCDDNPNGDGFTLSFHFRPNEYFSNTVLTKRYLIPNFLLEEEPVMESVKGCEIMWKPGKCLTHTEVKKTQRAKGGKKSGQIRTIIKKERVESFFHFFNPPVVPPGDDLDEEQADAFEEAFDHDYDIAQAFRTYVIPKAVLWFTGEELVVSDDDDDDDEEEDDDDDDNDNVE